MPRQWNAICAIKQRDIETPPCLARWPDGGVIAAYHKAHVALAYRESTTLLACRRHGGSQPLFPLVVDRFGFGPSMTSSSVRSNGCYRRLDRTCLARWPRPPLPPVAACNHLLAAYHRLRSSTLQERSHGTHRGAHRQAGRHQLHLRPVAFHQDRGRPPRGAGGRGSGHPLRAGSAGRPDISTLPQRALKVRPARSFRRLRNAGPISAPDVQVPPSPCTSRTRQRALSAIILLVEP